MSLYGSQTDELYLVRGVTNVLKARFFTLLEQEYRLRRMKPKHLFAFDAILFMCEFQVMTE